MKTCKISKNDILDTINSNEDETNIKYIHRDEIVKKITKNRNYNNETFRIRGRKTVR